MLPVVVLGGGGHACVLMDALIASGRTVIGFTSLEQPAQGHMFGVPYLGTDDVLSQYEASQIELVNGVGSVGHAGIRGQLYETYVRRGYTFAKVIHPSAAVSPYASLAQGVQVMAGAIVQARSTIGENVIINSRVSVDHDCVIGPHVHLAPGVVLSGTVHIGKGTHIGTGAAVIQGISIGSESIIGAGAVVVRDVADGLTVMGVPAKEVQR